MSAPSEDPYLEVMDLVATYDDRTILDGVDLQARRGEITVILGPSGCGKSTLLRHVAGLRRPTRGMVLLGGSDLYGVSEEEREELLKKLGVSFQGGALFNSMTLEDNVALPAIEHAGMTQEAARVLARMKLAQVGLLEAAGRLPSEISGGMQKRAALARALALDPVLLLFDEPSAGLDPVTAHELDLLILKLRDELRVAVVVVTHELASIRAIADQAIMLDQGKIIARGPLAAVERCPHPQVQAFFNRQAKPEAAASGEEGGLLTAISAEGT